VTDDRLRRARRRTATSRSAADEARYLTERVRAGELPPTRLGLAAYCGHPAARLAAAPTPPRAPADLEPWVRGLEAWGAEPLLRACLAAARLAAGEEELAAYPWPALEAVEAWVRCPCQAHLGRALGARSLGRLGLMGPYPRMGLVARITLGTCLGLARRGQEPDAVPRFATAAAAVAGLSSRDRGRAATRRALADALVPWALGEGDPCGHDSR